jgi:hypothetical protein
MMIPPKECVTKNIGRWQTVPPYMTESEFFPKKKKTNSLARFYLVQATLKVL